MAALGYRTFDEMVGQRQMLDQDQADRSWQGAGARLLEAVPQADALAERHDLPQPAQDHGLDNVLDRTPHRQSRSEAIEHGRHVRLDMPIRNSDRSTGAMLSGEIARRYGHAGLRDEAIHIKLKGTAGPELRRLPRQGRDARARGRGQRLCRQGPLGRTDHRLPAEGGDETRRRTPRSSSATPRFMARSPANAISAASRASVSACAIPARSRSSKARATTAANI